MTNNKLQTIILLAQNNPGVLNRIFCLIRRKNFNVETITARHTKKPNISKIIITFTANANQTKQLAKQLYKIIEVTKTDIK